MNVLGSALPVQIRLWDTVSGQTKGVWPSPHGVRSLAISPDGSSFVSADFGKSVEIRPVSG